MFNIKEGHITTNDDNSQFLEDQHKNMESRPNVGLISFQEIEMTKEIILILGILKKYLLLVDFKKELINMEDPVILKHQYDLMEYNYLIDIQTRLDLFYAYTTEHHILKNVDKIKERVDLLLHFLNENFVKTKPSSIQEYIDTLDALNTQISNVIEYISTKSIFEDRSQTN